MRGRKAILGDNPKTLKILVPAELYDYIRARAEREGVEIARVVRQLIFEAKRREQGGEK
ncbi:MAG: hypothetical protein QXU87_04080 [Candidatus Caldarchaeum sp.]